MRAYARWLFGSAAALNLSVGVLLLFLRGAVAPLIALDPITGTNLVLANLTGIFIALFGYAYFLVARDPVRYRPFISFGAIGKLLAVVGATVPWLTGHIPPTIPVLLSADLVYAILFFEYLRRT